MVVDSVLALLVAVASQVVQVDQVVAQQTAALGAQLIKAILAAQLAMDSQVISKTLAAAAAAVQAQATELLKMVAMVLTLGHLGYQ
jgi:hypothetical protein